MTTTSQKPKTLLEAVGASLSHAGRYNPDHMVAPPMGVLRYPPSIKWTKDRGKEPERPKAEHPWFWGWDEKTLDFMGGKTFDGNRWNDCHYTIKIKQIARSAGKGKP